MTYLGMIGERIPLVNYMGSNVVALYREEVIREMRNVKRSHVRA